MEIIEMERTCSNCKTTFKMNVVVVDKINEEKLPKTCDKCTPKRVVTEQERIEEAMAQERQDEDDGEFRPRPGRRPGQWSRLNEDTGLVGID